MSLPLSPHQTKNVLEERIGVWWDINTCPVPKGIGFRSVRSRIEWAVWKRCAYCPISIFCVGDLEHVDPQVLKGLSSSGIILRHVPHFGWSALCDHLQEWKKRNRLRAHILLISGDISWFTGSWFNSSILSLGYTIVRAFPAPRPPGYPSYKEWVWEELLLEAKDTNTNSQIPPKDEHALFCTLCNFSSQSCDDFIKHLNSDKHKHELAFSMLVVVDENNECISMNRLSLVDPAQCTSTSLGLSYNMTCLSDSTFCRILGQREKIQRVYSKTIGVWWDINTCPIPDGYDPGRVRLRIESELQAYIGYDCPVTIFCVGNLEFISPRVLKEISSSGIRLRHTILRGTAVTYLLREWEVRSPPPAKIMLISADETWFSSSSFSRGYTILRSLPDPQSFSSCMSTHAWAWESLLREESCLLYTHSITRSQSFPSVEGTNSGKDELDLCFCTVCEIPSPSCDAFIKHLKCTSHSQKLWEWVGVDKNSHTRFFCKFCNYPAYDHHNMKIHWSSEEHAQKVKETTLATKPVKKMSDRVTKPDKKVRDRLTKVNKKMETACMG